MKKFIPVVLLILILLPVLSCRHNRLKTNEKELANEILLQEKKNIESDKNTNQNKQSESWNKFSYNLRKKEIRSVDPQRPPILIDIPGTQKNIRKFKLSDFASSVRYVKLQTPPDTSLLYDLFFYRPELESNIRSDGEQIIFQGLFGLTRFNMQGEYQQTIWKNESGIRFYGKGAMYGGKDFFGVMPHIPVSILNGNLYFNFHDGPSGNGLVMKYKPWTNKKLSSDTVAEMPGQKAIPGDTIFNTRQEARFEQIYGIGTNTWAGINNKWNAGTTGSLLVTYNDKGDTLCQFTDFDRIVNFNRSSYRIPEIFASYYYNGQLTIKQEYNDTVFRLLPPDKLLPVYIIDFGEYKVNVMEGLNPDIDLSGKYLLNSLHETNDFILLRFTQNGDSPLNIKKKAVKFYTAVFYKNEGKLYHQPGYTLLPEGIENDLDGGMPFWPDFITPQGEMMKLVSGKVMKDYVNSPEFSKAVISNDMRKKQIDLVTGLKGTDMIIMIVK